MDVSTITNTSPFFWGYLGAASSLVFSAFGAGYGTYKSAQGIAEADKDSTNNDSFPFKFFIPIIISGVLAIYGLIYSVVALGAIDSTFTSAQGFATFGAGLAVGLSCLASGIATGIVSRKMIPMVGDSRKKFVGLVLILVYCEAIGLYGLIVSLLAQSSGDSITFDMQ